MAKLTDTERDALRKQARTPLRQPSLAAEERFVAATPAARERYIHFATQAARFQRGDKPVRFGGRCWKL